MLQPNILQMGLILCKVLLSLDPYHLWSLNRKKNKGFSRPRHPQGKESQCDHWPSRTSMGFPLLNSM